MAISRRRVKTPQVLPTTATGFIACGLFALSLLLLAARLLLTPMFGVPLNYLVVFITMAASGLFAFYAVALRHERGIASFITLVAGLLAATFLVAETFGGGPPIGPTLGESDNGATVTVEKGAQIMLQLPGNPTTGYSWQTTISNPGVLRESSVPLYKPIGDALGGGGTYTFWYEASASGRTNLTLVYSRSWETGVAPLNTFMVTIVVR